jgi:hypothetical protein
MGKLQTGLQGAATGAAVGGPIGAAIGGVGGFLLGGDDKDPNEILERMMREAQGIPLPILKEYYPELYQVVAALNPELETAVNLGPSAMEGIATDPVLRQAQLNALSRLQGIGEAGGMTGEDRARLMQIESETNANLKGNQDAIMQNLAARGMGGGMTEMVNRQLGAQAAANRQAQLGMDVKAQAERRALEALMQSGGMAGQMQGQDFSQAASKAQAQDAISKFNAMNQQQVLANQIGAKNQAQQYNVGMQQGVAGQNTGVRNQAQQYNLNLPQQQYENQMAKYGMQTGIAGQIAQGNAAQNAANAKWASDMMGAAAGAYGEYNKKQKKADDAEFASWGE